MKYFENIALDSFGFDLLHTANIKVRDNNITNDAENIGTQDKRDALRVNTKIANEPCSFDHDRHLFLLLENIHQHVEQSLLGYHVKLYLW